jgi:hypothetical protein
LDEINTGLRSLRTRSFADIICDRIFNTPIIGPLTFKWILIMLATVTVAKHGFKWYTLFKGGKLLKDIKDFMKTAK